MVRWNLIQPLLTMAIWAGLGSLIGCSSEPDVKDSHPSHAPYAETSSVGEHHLAPHGGLLTEIGEHAAHLEWVIDRDKGRIHLYILDGHGERGLLISQSRIPVEIQVSGRNDPVETEFRAVANALTGETLHRSSTFVCVHDELETAAAIQITIARLRVKGSDVGPLQASL